MTDLKPACAPDKGRPLSVLDEQEQRGRERRDGDATTALRLASGSLERFLIERGERVLRIPTHLTAKARKSACQRGKSDPIDARNVARAALQEGPDAFPAAQLDAPELDLPLVVDHRERLVRHRVELNSTLLWHPHDLWPEIELPGRAVFSKTWSSGPAGVWPTPNRRCAFASRATSCAACAS